MSKSNRSYSNLPEAYHAPDDFPEPYAAPNETLEVVRRDVDKQVAKEREDDAPEPLLDRTVNNGSGADDRGLLRQARRKRFIFLLVAAVLLIAIAIGVGVGVGISKSNRSNDAQDGGSTSSRNFTIEAFSTQGAFNGSDTAMTNRLRFDQDGDLVEQSDAGLTALLFYQHYTGEIRWMQHRHPDFWEGGTEEQVAALDAKNGTSMDTMVNRTNSQSTDWELHIFYINPENFVRQRFRKHGGHAWVDGPLNDLNIRALDARRVALRAGRYVYSHNSSASDGGTAWSCMKLFVGTGETAITELYTCPDIPWTIQQVWPNVNGQASPSYMGWTQNTSNYVAFVDPEDKVQLHWSDTSSDVVNPALATWVRASGINISDVDPLAGLSALSIFGTLVGRSKNDGAVTNWNVKADGGASTSSTGWTFRPPRILASSTLRANLDPTNPNSMEIFYQADGDDITMSTKNLVDGSWETVKWRIPAD